MNQLPNAIDIAKEAIKANPGLIKDCQESVDILVLLMIGYRYFKGNDRSSKRKK